MSTDRSPTVELTDVTKVYEQGAQRLHALESVDLTFRHGEFVAVVGASGAGKSTLLHLMGALDAPTAGRVALAGVDLTDRTDAELAELRRRHVGFVFQFFNLLPALTAGENVAFPLLLDRVSRSEARGRARRLLERVGLADRVDHLPSQLSGGEMQRVAIARALVGEPRLVLADEPTGNLDSQTGARVLDVLLAATRSEEATLVVVTHDESLAAGADRVVVLRDGRVAAEESSPTKATPEGSGSDASGGGAAKAPRG